MKFYVYLLVYLTGLVANGNAEILCFTCVDCQEPFVNDESLLQPCNIHTMIRPIIDVDIAPPPIIGLAPINIGPPPKINYTEIIGGPPGDLSINTDPPPILYPIDIEPPPIIAYHCFSVFGVEGQNVRVPIRGCVQDIGPATCRLAVDINRFPWYTECNLCGTSECNGGSRISIRYNFYALASLIIISIILRLRN